MLQKAKLIICVDRDNDLYEKVKISGPVIGREANLAAATKLALQDPTDTDANSMFEAIKTYDELRTELNVEIATLTGSRKLGYTADKEISEQLEQVIAQFPAESCIFISDGASDEEMLPIIRSRLKIDSVKIVVMKQAKELEKTYFVILEKLKEPYYARLIFGVPAVILLMFAASSYFGLGWQPVAFVIGLYLVVKSLGIEEIIAHSLSDFRFSIEKISSIMFVAAVPLVIISLLIGFQTYTKLTSESDVTSLAYKTELITQDKIITKTIQTMLVPLLLTVLLVNIGKLIDALNERKRIEVVQYGTYLINVVLLFLILFTAADWIVNETTAEKLTFSDYTSFQDILITILGSVVIYFISLTIMRDIKIDIISRMKLENKEVLSEVGAYIGKIMGVDRKNASLVVQSHFGQKFSISLDSVASVGEKVVVRQ